MLFARQDSIYKTLPGCDVFDIDRDARTWQGGSPVVAHPPCRAWGRLRQFAKPRADERDLALFAVEKVREFGGVLEHPASSELWTVAQLPRPGGVVQQRDRWDGWTLCVDQSWFGHACPKRTWLYIVGVPPGGYPRFTLQLGKAQGRVDSISKADREHTPEPFARWLVDLARRVRA